MNAVALILTGTSILVSIVTIFIILDTRKTLNRVYDTTCNCGPITVNLGIIKIHGQRTCKLHS
jgi:uncharacterized membrane protein